MADIRAKRAKTLTFLASFPPIQSAIKRGQDGMRIQLDIPETEMANAVGLMGMMNAVLKVTVEVTPADKVSKPTAKGDFKMEPLQS